MARPKGFSKILRDVLKSKVSLEEAEMLKEAGFNIKSPTKSAVIMVALYKKAASGDLSAIKELRLILNDEQQNECLDKAVVIVDDIKGNN